MGVALGCANGDVGDATGADCGEKAAANGAKGERGGAKDMHWVTARRMNRRKGSLEEQASCMAVQGHANGLTMVGWGLARLLAVWA